MVKQRELKRQLKTHTEKYDELVLKFEEKTRQIDTMHIYAQRVGKRPSDVSTNLAKSHSLQSLNETSPRLRQKVNDKDKKRREQQERENKLKPQEQRALSNDSSPKHEKKKNPPKKEQQNTMTTFKNSANDDKSSTTHHGNMSLNIVNLGIVNNYRFFSNIILL